MAEVQSASHRFKAAAPAGAAALAIVATITAVSLFGLEPAAVRSSGGEIVFADPAPAAPGPGSSIPGVAFDQVPGANPIAMDMEIVVKFKDDAKVKDIIDAFWRDQASARTKFDAFKANRAEFAGLKLDRVTYSNELVLVHSGDAPADRRLAVMRELAAKLKGVSDISYAEPNMTAHPGGQ